MENHKTHSKNHKKRQEAKSAHEETHRRRKSEVTRFCLTETLTEKLREPNSSVRSAQTLQRTLQWNPFRRAVAPVATPLQTCGRVATKIHNKGGSGKVLLKMIKTATKLLKMYGTMRAL